MSLNGDPINAPGPHLTALFPDDEMELGAIASTDVPLRKWQGIVVHSSSEGPETASRCHFVVEPSAANTSSIMGVSARGPWQQQESTRHVRGASGEWSGSIAICFAGDFSRQRPTNAQMAALMKLVNDLQKRFNIPASKVYLYRNIASSPADMFSEAEFNENLLQQ